MNGSTNESNTWCLVDHLIGFNSCPKAKTKKLFNITKDNHVFGTTLFAGFYSKCFLLKSVALNCALYKSLSLKTYLIKLSSSMNPIAMNFSSIEPFNGENFKKWRHDVEIILGLMDYDLALREEEPVAIIANSTVDYRHKHERWEKSNRMCILVIKRTISEFVRRSIPICEKT